MWPRYGIKVGNSTLCIATVNSDGKIEVIANKQGDRVSQACLLFEGNQLECGLTAKQKMASRPQASISNSLQFLLPDADLTEDKLTTLRKYVPCAFDTETKQFQVTDPASETEETRNLSAKDVWVELFKSEFELAKQSQSDDKNAPVVVLSIPHYYPKESWKLLTGAAETAGFHVAQVVPEQTAAVLAYKFGEQTAESQYVLCIKSGGLLSSFTLFEVLDGTYRVVESIGPFYIGGKQFTDVLVDFISAEFYKKYKLDPNESRRSMAKIRVAAENCKHCLSSLPTTQVYIDSLMDGVDFNMQMSRARYEMLIQPVLNNFLATLNEAKAKFAEKLPADAKITQVVLTGATMKITKFQELLGNAFADATLHTSFASDEVVSIGCAYQASCLADPSSQDLEETFRCAALREDVFIWNDANTEQKKLLFAQGTIIPVSKRLDVPEHPAGKPVFHISTSKGTHEFTAKDAKSVDGVYSVNIAVDVTFEENNLKSKLVFKCL